MVKGTLDWDAIDLEVCGAVDEFFAKEKITTGFIDVKRLTVFVELHPHRNLRPHLRGGWYRIHTRLTTCMRRMGWEKWSSHVYVVPMDKNGKIIRPTQIVSAKIVEGDS
jgi:hypothetical protein